MYSLPNNYKKLTYNQKIDLVDNLICNYKLSPSCEEDIWEEIYKNDSLKTKPQMANRLLEEIEKKINTNEILILKQKKEIQSEKKYSIEIIIIGVILTTIFIYLFKGTTFFDEPVEWWKYFIVIPIGFIFCGITLQISLYEFIKHKLTKLGMYENIADLISIIILFILFGVLYFWVN